MTICDLAWRTALAFVAVLDVVPDALAPDCGRGAVEAARSCELLASAIAESCTATRSAYNVCDNMSRTAHQASLNVQRADRV